MLFVILGKVGAGKSTLVNRLTGLNDAHVEHNIAEDGTNEVKVYGERFVDTPGLDSKQWRTGCQSIKDVVGSKKFVVVFAISKRDGRINNVYDAIGEILKSCVNSKLIVVWTNTAESPEIFERHKTNVGAKFGNTLITQIDSEDVDFKTRLLETGDSEANFNSFKQVAAPPLVPVIKAGRATTSSSVAAATKAPKKGPPAPLGPLKRNLLMFNSVQSIKPPNWSPSVKARYANTTATFFEELRSMKSENTVFFKHLTQMGDAFLKAMFYATVFNLGIEPGRELASLSQEMLGNGETDVMNTFFNKYAPPEMKDDTGTKYGEHSKADFVEALVEYTVFVKNHEMYTFVLKELIGDGIRRLNAKYRIVASAK